MGDAKPEEVVRIHTSISPLFDVFETDRTTSRNIYCISTPLWFITIYRLYQSVAIKE